MARSRYCRICRDFHDLEKPWPEACAAHFGSQADAGFYVISDSMDPIRSMASGRMHDSKSAYRKELKQLGCIEVGNERMTPKPTPRPPVRDALRQAYQQLRG